MKKITLIAMLMVLSSMSFGQSCKIITKEKNKTYVICEDNPEEVYSLKKVGRAKSLVIQSEATLQEIDRIQNDYDKTQAEFEANYEKARILLKLLEVQKELNDKKKELGEKSDAILLQIEEINQLLQ